MSHTRTYTYSVLEVDQDTFNGVKQRLVEANSLEHYLDADRQYGQILNLGTVALAVDRVPRKKSAWCCSFHQSGASLDLECQKGS